MRPGPISEQGGVVGVPTIGACSSWMAPEAESMDDAVALLDGCPMDMWVYEAMPM